MIEHQDDEFLCRYEINLPKDKYQIILDLINKLSEHIGDIDFAYNVSICGSHINDIINRYKDVESSLHFNSIHSNEEVEVDIAFNKLK